jgi:mono/diheme cytochrome c family protein
MNYSYFHQTLHARLLRYAATALLGTLLMSCGGRENAGEIFPNTPVAAEPPVAAPVTSAAVFLQMPNPQLQPDGSSQLNTLAYAQAYYEAIDPTSQRDTLARWKQQNGFDSAGGTQVNVAFGDKRDLAWGRNLTARRNADGSMAFLMENFQVNLGKDYAYTPLNAEAAALRDPRWQISSHAIEFSSGPNGGAPFVKFFSFDPLTGKRELTADMDGKGEKAVPGTCIACHGGRGDPLTPPDANGKPRFPLLANAVSQSRGDVNGRLQVLEVGALDFYSAHPFARADQEGALKTINMLVLCSYPVPGTSSWPEDACRRSATASEFQGTPATFLKAAYGGPGMPNAAYADNYVEKSWVNAGQSVVYTDVYAQVCRSCHIVRGNGSQSDVDMETFTKFDAYAPAIKALVFDRGSMPLSELLSDKLYVDGLDQTLANYLQSKGMVVRDASGAVLKPDRPIADPGPERTVRQGAIGLSAAASLNANAYKWSIVSGPTGATLSDAAAVNPVFSAGTDGTYLIQLIALNGAAQSAPVQFKIVVNNALSPAPAAIRFADVKAVLTANACASCHRAGGDTPDIYQTFDRNGDGVVDATDDKWFYTEVRGRINFTSLASSPLLTKPSGRRHVKVAGFDSTKVAGQPERRAYDLFLNWILNGANP